MEEYVPITDSYDPSVYHILVVEDSEVFQAALGSVLDEEGYGFDVASTGAQASTLLVDRKPDLVILDLGLPDIDGLDLCRQIRASSDALIVMLTGRDDDQSRFTGLDIGADEYLTKPFDRRELLMRVKVLLRRRPPRDTPPDILSDGDLVVDRRIHEATVDSKVVKLTKIETSILYHLMSHQRDVVTKEELVRAVWGLDWVGDDHVIRVHVANLRKKIASDHSERIATVRGIGYRFLASNRTADVR